MYAAPPAPFIFAVLLVGLLALNIAFLGFLIQVGRDDVPLITARQLRLVRIPLLSATGLVTVPPLQLAHIPLFSAIGYLLVLLFHVMFLAFRESVAPGENVDSVAAMVELFSTFALLASLLVALVWLLNIGYKAAGTKGAGTKAAGTKGAGTKGAGTKGAGTKN